MKQKLLLTLVAVFSFILLKAQNFIEGQYIVNLKESYVKPVSRSQIVRHDRRAIMLDVNKPERDNIKDKIKTLQSKNNIKPSSVLFEFADASVGFTAKLTKNEKEALEQDPDVESVIQSYYFEIPPNERSSSGQTSLEKTIDNKPVAGAALSTQSVPCGIAKVGGFANGEQKATWIWILDTGVDLDHPDLNVETTYAKSFVTSESSADDFKGHGTHVAGIAAAKDNSIGVVGVSAGATIVPVKVLDRTGRGDWEWLMKGLQYVLDNAIAGDVVNMSIWAPGYLNCENSDIALRNRIRELGNAGIYVVMIAGNNNTDAIKSSPGCIDGAKLYTVAAIDCSNTWWNDDLTIGSNWNKSTRSFPVDWVSIGVNVKSTIPGGRYGLDDGTSMAAPHVAGIIHARGGPPRSVGTVTYKGRTYKIASR